MDEIKGGCACKAVRYSLTQAPKFQYLCQCKQCQKATGSGHAALMMVMQNSLEIEGELRFFEQRADSGNTMAVRFLNVGSLDDPASFQPTQILWNSEGHPWDSFDTQLKVNERGV